WRICSPDGAWAKSGSPPVESAANRSPLAERCRLRELVDRRRHVDALAGKKILDRAPQRRIVDVVRRIGGDRQIAARDLVLALGAGLDAGELPLDGVLDRLVIAQLEMQERM